MTAPVDSRELFDAYYFAHGCGPQPYRRDEAWLAQFDMVAQNIVAGLQPASVLDAGCAFGMLVEALRRRGVEAFGIDISKYAIANVHPDVLPFVRRCSLTDELERSYDLIVCIEVVEHMPAREGERVIENMCRHTEMVLFSSSPLDFRETTHFNVQPPEYWSELFARHCFYHDVEFDATFITPWSALYRKGGTSMPRLVRAYERRWWQLQHENTELRALAREMRQQLAAQNSSLQETAKQLAALNNQLVQLHAQTGAEIARLEHDRKYWYEQVLRFEQGRIMRALRWLHEVRQRTLRKP